MLNEVSERLRYANYVHRAFVDKMHLRFGVAPHPGYCVVQILPLISAGGFNYGTPDQILLNDVLCYEPEIYDTVAHETGHFLHGFARRMHEKGRKCPTALCELVAILGCAIHYETECCRSRADEYLRTESEQYAKIVGIAEVFFEKAPHLLSLLANTSLKNAKRLLAAVENDRKYQRKYSYWADFKNESYGEE